jgi:hypothetical protein
MQTMPDPLPKMVSRIAPRDAMGYARSRGWQQFRKSGNLMVFNRPESGSLDQVLVPVDAARPDYVERMREAVERLAAFENRPATVVAADLLQYDADVLRFRVDSPGLAKGSIPLSQGIDLLTGARQSILAAAHSVLSPRKFHPKLSRSEAQQLLERCDLNQTEQRSFVVAISCPMRSTEVGEASLFENDEPFARRTCLLLGDALLELDQSIQEDRINGIVDQETPIVSENLCDALLKMRPPREDGILEFLPSWAPSTPARATGMPGIVRFSADEFPAIEDIYRQIRTREEPLSNTWVALVEELKGTESEEGVREGEVVFTLIGGGETIRARANLTVEQYRIAYEAHNPSVALELKGVLHRGPRLSRINPLEKLTPFHPKGDGGGR